MRHDLPRRRFLAATAALVTAPSSRAFASTGSRTLAFNNIHTGERLKVDYWTNGDYDRDALAAVDHLLRDFRNGEVHVIEPKLLDLLCALKLRLDTSEPFDVISGYRSPATNAMLHAEHSGVAAKSLHMQGMAIDIRIADRSLKSLHDAALELRAGGVGYYPQPDFVHVDVGRVRTW